MKLLTMLLLTMTWGRPTTAPGRHLDQRPLLFAPGKVSVVLHLRRADLERDDTRATADGYYYRLAKEQMQSRCA